MNKLIPILAFSVLLLVPAGAQNAFATQFSCSTNLSGANEVPPTGSPGSGTLTGTYDDTTNQLSWNISWFGLLSPETAMHFHGPALVNQNAGVEVNVGAISGLISPSIGNTVINGAQETDLLAGLWYLNLHTSLFPGGDIRGQVSCVADEVVIAGEIIPIEQTSLLLASAQSFSFMIPVLLSGIGIGIFVVSRKS